MDSKSNMNMNFMQVPGAPLAPPMYPTIDNQMNQLPPVVFFNEQPRDAYQKQMPPTVPESRPTSVFILNGNPPLGPEPLKTNCPHCNTSQTSRVVSRVCLKTHFAALICCVLGLFCLVPIPYCMNSFKNLYHYCSNCGQYLGPYSSKITGN